MNKRMMLIVVATMVALFAEPLAAHGRYLNPDTGRFQTMDSYEGNTTGPMSLHKYLYAHADPVNNTDPLGLEVQHAARDLDGVAVGTHQFIILTPDNPGDFEGASAGAKLLQALGIQLEAVGGQRRIVVGAHNVNARLQVKFFQVADNLATRELVDASYSVPWYQSDFDAEGHIIAAPSGKTDTQFISELLQAVQSYIGNEDVSNIPYPKAGMFKGKYNSNSWATSLIRHVGAIPWLKFKGGTDVLNKAQIPAEYFKLGGVKPGTSLGQGPRLNGFHQIPTYLIPLGF